MNYRTLKLASTYLTLLFVNMSIACTTTLPSNTDMKARPYELIEPARYDPQRPTPLLILLHGYQDTGNGANRQLQLEPLANERTFLYAIPNGTVDSKGNHFWNATDACCNFDDSHVDDVAYLTALIDDVESHYNVDPERIFLVGHSNGAFMSQRMACDLSTRIAAIVSLAGANWFDESRCQTEVPVSVLQVHGDADTNVPYVGGARETVPFPSAIATSAGWAQRNGCSGTMSTTGVTLDLDSSLSGRETTVSAFGGCPSDGAAELWTIHGGGHMPSFGPEWAPSVFDWLTAHPKRANINVGTAPSTIAQDQDSGDGSRP